MEIFINATCGIEVLQYLDLKDKKVNFVRFQSTLLEGGYNEIFINDVDYNFLMYLALGYECIVFDYTSRWKDRPSRAIWQGLELIRYCLHRAWWNEEIKCERNMHIHFKKEYEGFQKKTKKRLKYFRKFLLTDGLRLFSVCKNTVHDGDHKFYKEILKKWKQ